MFVVVVFFFNRKVLIFFLFLHKKHMLWVLITCTEALLRSHKDIRLCRDIKTILCGYSLLFVVIVFFVLKGHPNLIFRRSTLKAFGVDPYSDGKNNWTKLPSLIVYRFALMHYA